MGIVVMGRIISIRVCVVVGGDLGCWGDSVEGSGEIC